MGIGVCSNMILELIGVLICLGTLRVGFFSIMACPEILNPISRYLGGSPGGPGTYKRELGQGHTWGQTI